MAKYGPKWLTLFNVESPNGNWEITHHSDEQKVVLLWVPEENYSEKDVMINLTYDQMDDLVLLIKRVTEIVKIPQTDPLIDPIRRYAEADDYADKQLIYDNEISEAVETIIQECIDHYKRTPVKITEISKGMLERARAKVRVGMVNFPFKNPNYDGDGNEMHRYLTQIIFTSLTQDIFRL